MSLICSTNHDVDKSFVIRMYLTMYPVCELVKWFVLRQGHLTLIKYRSSVLSESVAKMSASRVEDRYGLKILGLKLIFCHSTDALDLWKLPWVTYMLQSCLTIFYVNLILILTSLTATLLNYKQIILVGRHYGKHGLLLTDIPSMQPLIWKKCWSVESQY